MKRTLIVGLLAGLASSPVVPAEDDTEPNNPDQGRPIDRKMKIFPVSTLAEHVDFKKVAYFRSATESGLKGSAIIKIDPKVAKGEDLSGLILAPRRRPIDEKHRNRLAVAITKVPLGEIAAEQRRPWAGGIKSALVAFSAEDLPLFSIDLQTTTPTEVVFDKVWPLNADLVRYDCRADYFESFYYEIDSAEIAVELFAIALELRSEIPAVLPGQK